MRRAPGSWTDLITQLGFKRSRQMDGRKTKIASSRGRLGSQPLRVEQLEDRRMLAVLTVDTNTDVADAVGDGDLSLREAIAVVNQGGNYLTASYFLPGGLRVLSQGEKDQFNVSGGGLGTNDSILLTSRSGTITLSGTQLDISEDVVIVGPGSEDLTIDANGLSQIFVISGDGTIDVSIGGLTLTDGATSYSGGAIYSDGASLALDDLVVTDNTADVSGGGAYLVAAHSLEDVTISVTNCVFEGNGSGGLGIGAGGGGLYLYLRAEDSATVEDSIFRDNHTIFGDGGGLYVDIGSTDSDASSSLGDFTIERSVITLNTSGSPNSGRHGAQGGGMYIGVGKSQYYANLFSANLSATVIVDQCLIYNNTTTLDGGGLYFRVDVAVRGSNNITTRVSNTTIANNHTTMVGESSAHEAYGGGGGLAMIARHYEDDDPFTTEIETETAQGDYRVINCTISGNDSYSAGGVLVEGSVAFSHCTIVNNQANGIDYNNYVIPSGGGGVMLSGIKNRPYYSGYLPNVASFDHCIVAGNQHATYPEDIVPTPNFGITYADGSGTPDPDPHYPQILEYPLYNEDPRHSAGVSVIHSVIQLNSDASPGGLLDTLNYISIGEGGGNVYGDAQLHALADNGGPDLPGSYALLTHALGSGSSAIDAGNPSITTSGGSVPSFDERGTPFVRVFEWPGEELGRIDIGAYERQFVEPANGDADFDNDNDVDGADFLTWQRGLGISSGASHSQGDADFDTDVDLDDLFIWRQQFGDGMSSVVNANYNSLAGVDGADYMIWKANHGMATGADLDDGDADNDNDVDMDDYLAWQIQYSIETGLLEWMVHTLDFQQLATLTANQILVSTLEDSSDGDYTLGDLSLREALEIADALGGSREIVFANHLAGTIELNGTQLVVASNVNIVGPGVDRLTIDAGGDSRVFEINGAYAVGIRGMKITGGGGVNQGGGIYNNNSGTLTLDSVRVTDNQTNLTGSVNGGGVYSAYGSLQVINSTFDDNDSRYGGGLYVYVDQSSDVVLIANSTISGNTAYDGSQTGAGGGITISSTSGNTNVTIVGTTISGNSAGHSGGVRIAGGPVAIVNCTITDNDALQSSEGGQGGGIAVVSSGALTLNNTIVADNTAYSGYPDLVNWATVNTSSNNLIGDAGNSGITNSTNGNMVIGTSGDPGLLPLGDYGGPTLTHALEYDSPAIDQGNNSLTFSAAIDQRGDHRTVSRSTTTHTVDIGAYELGLVVSTDVDDNDTNYNYGDFSLREALYLASFITGTNEIEFDPDLLDGETITLAYGQLSIDSNIKILGLGEDSLAVDANGLSRVFSLNGTYDATISGLTITGGAGVNQGGGIYNNNNGTLRLDGVRITGNQTNLTGSVNGGGVYSAYGSLYVTNSTIDANDSRYGGGLYIYVDQSTDVVQILRSTISNNTAYVGDQTGSGGGLTISSTSGNNNILIGNTTISGNSAGHSGGVRIAGGPVTILGSTITDNHALQSTDGAQGGGVAVVSSGSLTIINSIVADNTAYGGYADLVNWATVNTTLSVSNLIGDVGNSGLSASANIVIGTSGDPGLMPLADYGGPTWTHKLGNGSQAIDAGNAVAASLYLYDQRGSLRFDDGNGDALVGLDIGAFELSADEYFEGLGA
jgi:hypothetical protein